MKLPRRLKLAETGWKAAFLSEPIGRPEITVQEGWRCHKQIIATKALHFEKNTRRPTKCGQALDSSCISLFQHMADVRKHRGPHPADKQLFAAHAWPALQTAVSELSWLLNRGYAVPSSLKLVGDRHELQERQRTAVKRSACTTNDLELRERKHIPLAGEDEIWIDGFNLLTTVEAALAGGVIIVGRDGCYRDMASMHGTYRKVEETRPALALIGSYFEQAAVKRVRWLLDSPVSNSGRLAGIMRDVAAEAGWTWEVETVPDPDPVLAECEHTVVSADSMILNRCQRWTNVAAAIVGLIEDAWIVPMGDQ